MGERIFHGERLAHKNIVYTLNGEWKDYLQTSPRPGRTIPGEWNWGYSGTGPRQLAWDLAVALFANRETAEAAAIPLLRDFVSQQQGATFQVSEFWLRSVCADVIVDLGAPPPEIEGGMKLDD